MFKTLDIKDEALALLKDFTIPQEIGFGKILSPVMITCEYKDGKWEKPQMVPYAPLSIDPTSKVLHYGQEIFEGMKAYNFSGNGPNLFRPLENYNRFNFSARRMAMPEVPEDIFMDSVKAITYLGRHFIPRRSGESLYIRPFMFATEEHLGIKPSENFLFMVVASPSGAYFSSGNIKVMIERDAVRAAPGGTGAAKTGGNYAASLISAQKAKALGFDQTLWLDAVDRKFVEELSGMNFFAVINNELITPPVSETILDGITRKSLLKLAEHNGIKTKETPIDVSDLIKAIQDGSCTEAFACGTAAILTPIGEICEKEGDSFKLAHDFGPVSKKLRSGLLDIQEGRGEDFANWIMKVEG